MGSNCCRQKDQSPRVSLRKVFARWCHRISPTTDTVKIADAEDGYVSNKKRDSISDPVFESPHDDRNRVTMLLPDAPRIPPRKNNKPDKRVSFQSDVEIMRTASSKSLDRFTVTIVQEDPKARSKSFDSYFDKTVAAPQMEYLKERRTSSLEHLTVEDIQAAPSLIAKLRRDTLGDALDFQAYKRPLVLPKPDEPLIEEESDGISTEEDEEISSFKLAAKLRRDTLGVLLASRSNRQPDTPIDSSNEDLEETVKHSRLCSKLRRDTFGDALRQAVHCKACSSLEDITELEVPLPATPEEEEEDEPEVNEALHISKHATVFNTNENSIKEETRPDEKIKPGWSRVDSVTRCKTCLLEVESEDNGQCSACSSAENIPDLSNVIRKNIQKNSKTPEIKISEQSVELTTLLPVKQLLLTDADITTTLEKIRTTGKIEPREPYNLVYSSHMKGPFASSKESINKDENGKSSSADSLNVHSLGKDGILNSEQNRNQLVT